MLKQPVIGVDFRADSAASDPPPRDRGGCGRSASRANACLRCMQPNPGSDSERRCGRATRCGRAIDGAVNDRVEIAHDQRRGPGFPDQAINDVGEAPPQGDVGAEIRGPKGAAID